MRTYDLELDLTRPLKAKVGDRVLLDRDLEVHGGPCQSRATLWLSMSSQSRSKEGTACAYVESFPPRVVVECLECRMTVCKQEPLSSLLLERCRSRVLPLRCCFWWLGDADDVAVLGERVDGRVQDR